MLPCQKAVKNDSKSFPLNPESPCVCVIFTPPQARENALWRPGGIKYYMYCNYFNRLEYFYQVEFILPITKALIHTGVDYCDHIFFKSGSTMHKPMEKIQLNKCLKGSILKSPTPPRLFRLSWNGFSFEKVKRVPGAFSPHLKINWHLLPC